jgi:major membrane immunogen (membrane-anchored lipoprotein)
MKHHRHLKVVVLGAAVLLLAVVNASAKGAKTFNVPYAGLLGSARIEAGHYQITWEEHSPGATVTVAAENGKIVVATAQGKLVERSTKYQRNMVVYTAGPDGTQVISELRIGGSNKAIVFEE